MNVDLDHTADVQLHACTYCLKPSVVVVGFVGGDDDNNDVT